MTIVDAICTNKGMSFKGTIKPNNLSFKEAMNATRSGKVVSRTAWDSDAMVFRISITSIPLSFVFANNHVSEDFKRIIKSDYVDEEGYTTIPDDANMVLVSDLFLRTALNVIHTYVMSKDDIKAKDWYIVKP